MYFSLLSKYSKYLLCIPSLKVASMKLAKKFDVVPKSYCGIFLL